MYNMYDMLIERKNQGGKGKKSKAPLHPFNAYIQYQRLFSGALILQYEIAVFFKASKVLALRLLAIHIVTQKRRELLKTAFLWSKNQWTKTLKN